MHERPKLLIDTDVGDDIDDAFALFFAVKLGYEIVGVTTVYRDTAARARLTKKLLSLFGEKGARIPVYTGHGPAFGGQAPLPSPAYLCQQPPAPSDARFAPDGEDPDEAVDFIISACERYGKELTVAAIGPFTNMARVIEKDPTALGKAKKVAVMGGAFYKQYADWNVMCDVEAAEVMFRAADNLECMGADVTHQLDIGEENSRYLLRLQSDDPAAAYVCELYRQWQLRSGGCAVLHDPLVILYAGEPEVCRMEDVTVSVITEGVARGVTLNVDAYSKAAYNPACEAIDRTHKIKAAAEVRREYVIERFMECFR